jgi:glycosyltransferase involved in cell wall biosynthesis
VNDETGYLVKSDIEFSEKLASLLTDPELRKKLAAGAVQHSLQFDWDKVARDWESVFVEAAAKRRKKK